MSKLGIFETPNSYKHAYFSNLLNLLTGTDTRGHEYHKIRVCVHKITGS